MLTQVSPLLYAWRTHTHTHMQRHVRSGYTALEIELCTLHIRNVSQATLLTARCALFPSVSSASVWKLPCCRPNLMFLVLYFSPSSSSLSFCEHTTNSNDFYISSIPLLLSLFLPWHLPILHHQANRQAGSCLSFWLPPQPTLSEDILLCVL